MADNQGDTQNNRSASPSWQLRSPGRPADKGAKPAASRLDPQPKSASFAPQHSPVASAVNPGPVTGIKNRFDRLSGLTDRLSARTKWALAAGSLVTVSSAIALLSQISPSQADTSPDAATLAIKTAPAATDPHNRIMGTGKPYVAPPPEPPKLALHPQRDFEKLSRQTLAPVVHGEIGTLIKTAAFTEGLHPDLMIELFGKESGLGHKDIKDVLRARSDTNASGICQFTEQTFLSAMARDGERLGFGQYADAIYTVTGKNNRTYYTAGRHQRDVLNLRFDPKVAIPLCAAHIKRDLMAMKPYIGRPLTFADSATSHFTGWAVAKDIIRAYDDPRSRRDPAYIYAERGNYAGSHTNMSLFFRNGDRRKPYTVGEFYEAKMRIVGNTQALLSTPLPNGTRLARSSP